MNANDLINYFSSNLYFATKEDKIYLIDDYRLGDSDYDYGVCSEYSIEDMMLGNFNIDDIPDIYVDGYFEFLLDEDLKATYNVPNDVIKRLSQESYCEWDVIFKRNEITDIPSHLNNVCRIMKCEEEIEGMTQNEIAKYCNYGDDYTLLCIEKYEKQLEDERDEL